MKKIALVSITLLILILGISCASAAAVDHSAGSTLKKDYQGSVKKVGSPVAKAISKKAAKKTTKNVTKKVAAKKSVRPVDKIINGWDPKKHQVSCKKIEKGIYRVTYDDGYHRVIDSQGNILSYGY